MSCDIGLYGGSFNPVHHGHLIAARTVAEQLGLSRVILLPSARPPHKHSADLLAARHRAEMVRLAVAAEPLFECSDVDLTREGPSYTFDTVQHFQRQHGPGTTLHWIIGADSLVELPTWYRINDLIAACRIVTARRPGWDEIDWEPLRRALGEDCVRALRAGIVSTPRIDISSTEIRERLAAGLSVRFLVPDAVLEYIMAYGLYRQAGSG